MYKSDISNTETLSSFQKVN